ncbi:MAG TPA: mechanosensitive ion channel domain-containing protein, partial [Tepidisphaeraceae bacterium]|nr:mechanosensitive ion channel domain-containing protein [Tepidisphaeraceae bacterium]
ASQPAAQTAQLSEKISKLSAQLDAVAAQAAKLSKEQAAQPPEPTPEQQEEAKATRPVRIFGVTLVGFTRENGKKLLMTAILIAVLVGLSWVMRVINSHVLRDRSSRKVIFWARQGFNLLVAVVLLIGIVSIWFSDASHFAMFAGLLSAGVAFALQKPIGAFAGYIVILRGKTFNVGDRIVMGGVRGDVIELGFYQTTIMEMGEPPAVQDAPPSVWVGARQYTGRVVTVPNSVVFDGPIFNFTREFPYIWEEMRIPISYKDDRRRAEEILLDVADRHTVHVQEMSEKDIEEMERRYFVKRPDLRPKVYLRLTDNWVELTVRFITRPHGIRDLKNQISREVIDALDAAKIGIASSTYDVVGMPPLRVQVEEPART